MVEEGDGSKGSTRMAFVGVRGICGAYEKKGCKHYTGMHKQVRVERGEHVHSYTQVLRLGGAVE